MRRVSALQRWLAPPNPEDPAPLTDVRERRGLGVEILVVFAVTLGLTALRSLVQLAQALARPQPLSSQHAALNAPQASIGVLDLLAQLAGVLQLAAWAALGAYLLWRGGIALHRVGLDRAHPGRDVAAGLGLAALIGVPGLGFYLAAHALGLSVTVQPSTLDDAWWRTPVLVLSAFGNAAAEEVLVVAYLLTRARQLGWSENRALWISAVLRGAYHLYQGFGGFLGNLVMGLVYGRVWQRTNRPWALVIGHGVIDVVAFVGYALLRGRVSWLP